MANFRASSEPRHRAPNPFWSDRAAGELLLRASRPQAFPETPDPPVPHDENFDVTGEESPGLVMERSVERSESGKNFQTERQGRSVGGASSSGMEFGNNPRVRCQRMLRKG